MQQTKAECRRRISYNVGSCQNVHWPPMDWEPKFKIRIPMVVLESIFSFFSHWLDFSRQEYCPTYIWKGFCKPEIYVFTGNHQCVTRSTIVWSLGLVCSIKVPPKVQLLECHVWYKEDISQFMHLWNSGK